MSLTVPPFPPYDEIPSPQELANHLVCAVPEPDRKAASDLLVSRILPVKLAGIDHHPRPERLSVVVYKELARTLTARPANMRLHALKLVALGAELQRVFREALNLAIARFLIDHTGNLDAERLERWLNPAVQDLRMLSAEELTEQAVDLEKALKSWKYWVTGDYPTEWPKHRTVCLQTQAMIQSAKTASFDSATGSLLEFLRDADRKPEELTFD
ncbi:MAG: hypothetical protein MJE77_08320 [Proteobacteria bacterium]|nr:hypothetical protein [Pseudomonadota bacterium]